MPSNEKEINNNLFDQLTIVERLEKAFNENTFEKESEIIKAEINRKLYQKPPLTETDK
ncbi:MAG: hypothetical protein IJ075_06220 [Lachnospiraceae bacterium]|nr:hypothetical protein [Lachnospiraceae bacterium]MBQ9607467.1 hypothetical protein [Lachnospiraceae bacterium]MBR1524494.1 hypothetical protein [Lachnospiraceae bacterium]